MGDKLDKLCLIVLSLSAAYAINYMGRNYEIRESYFNRFHLNDVILKMYEDYRKINKEQDFKINYRFMR